MNIKEIVEDYELNFSGKQCLFRTSYNKLPEILVRFEVEDLFHILGIHKLDTGLRAKKWIEKVKKNQFLLSDYSKHSRFSEVLPRVRNYEFFYEIFYQDKVKVCILNKDLMRNTMNLSVVFYKDEKKKVIVIGIRRTSEGYYVPATLHESKSNTYSRMKKTSITKVSLK